jgi:hypothetical protein
MARVVFDRGPGKLGQLQPGEKLQVVLERLLVGANFEHSGGANFDSTNQPKNFAVFLAKPSNAARPLRGRITIIGGLIIVRHRWSWHRRGFRANLNSQWVVSGISSPNFNSPQTPQLSSLISSRLSR